MTRPAYARPVPRIQSVDVLRGIVMIIMALDHIRDFFHYESQLFSPEDLTKTTAALFFTRWATHFCAPVFVFLAGTGSYLATRRGMSRGAVSWFLVTRGLWLVVVEMTLVLFGATFNLSYRVVVWQVIWAIGWSMVALSVLIYLPRPALLLFSVAMIAGHNTLDGVSSAHMASLGWMWKILHEGFAQIALRPGTTVIVAYPLIPWIGVMSAGYCFGRVFDLPPPERRALMFRSLPSRSRGCATAASISCSGSRPRFRSYRAVTRPITAITYCRCTWCGWPSCGRFTRRAAGLPR